MMHPEYPRIVADRDEYRNWYLDEDVLVTLQNGDSLQIRKGFRFDAHSVPWWARWMFSKKYGNDIYAALVHDYLVDTAPWHRYNRKFIDNAYTYMMNLPWYKDTDLRSHWMPLAVRVYGWFVFDIWGDYRGEPKPNTIVDVRVMYDT